VRGLTDAPLGRGKANFGAHAAVEKRVGLRRRRPHRLVEPAEQHEVEAQQTRFQQAEYFQPRMAAARGRGGPPGERALEYLRIVAQAHGEAVARRKRPFFEPRIELLALGRRQQVVGLGQRDQRLAMGREEVFERRLARELPQRRQCGFHCHEPLLGGDKIGLAEGADRAVGVCVLLRLAGGGQDRRDVFQAARRQRRSQQREFEHSCGFAEADVRVVEQGGQRFGRKIARGGQRQPRQRARPRLPEHPPGRILHLDAPAREFGGDAPRQRRFRRHQRRRAPWRLQDFAHRHGQRQRLFVLVFGDDER